MIQSRYNRVRFATGIRTTESRDQSMTAVHVDEGVVNGSGTQH